MALDSSETLQRPLVLTLGTLCPKICKIHKPGVVPFFTMCGQFQYDDGPL